MLRLRGAFSRFSSTSTSGIGLSSLLGSGTNLTRFYRLNAPRTSRRQEKAPDMRRGQILRASKLLCGGLVCVRRGITSFKWRAVLRIPRRRRERAAGGSPGEVQAVNAEEVERDLTGKRDLLPTTTRVQPPESRDCLRCAGGLKFVAYRRGDQNPFEQFRQDVLQIDENEVVQRRRVGDDDH